MSETASQRLFLNKKIVCLRIFSIAMEIKQYLSKTFVAIAKEEYSILYHEYKHNFEEKNLLL